MLLAWVVAILLLILSGGIANDNGGGTTLRQILGYVVLALIVGGLLFFGWQVLRWQNEEFIVIEPAGPPDRGRVNKRVVDSSLEKINDAILVRVGFGRVFGFGDLES